MSDDIFTAHFRGERAIAAARRWISKNVNKTISSSDVAEFLKRRQEPLSPDEIDWCAREAMKRWMSSRANRYRGAELPR